MNTAIDAALLRLVADLVLLLHVAVVAFIVGALPTIVVGNWRGWQLVNRRGFRRLHLTAIGVVVAEAWLGLTCPLTTLEMRLRAAARGSGDADLYEGGFIEHWLQSLLYFDAPPWFFTLAYTVFGALTLWVWRRFPTEPARRESGSGIGSRRPMA